MTTTHFRDDLGRPVGTDQVDSRAEIAAAVINDTFERQYVVTVDTDTVACVTCDHDCAHDQEIEHALEAVVES